MVSGPTSCNFLMRPKTSPRARLCGKAAGMSWYSSFAMQLSMDRKGEVKKLTMGWPEVNCFPLWQDVGVGKVTSRSQGGWLSSSHVLTKPGVTRRIKGSNEGVEEAFPCSAR